MKNLLISGAGGFLGTYFTEAFRNSHHIVTIGRKEMDDYEHIPCDLAHQIPLLPDLAYDTVIHNAGLAHQEALKKSNPERFFQVNARGTQHLIESLKKLSLHPERIVLISTVAVYGCEEGSGIIESQPLNGHDPYALSKMEAEQMLLAYCEKAGIPCFIFRLPLVIGKHHKGNMRRLIDSIRKGRYVQIKENMALKSMVLASDVAELAGRLHNKPSGIYHLTDRIDHRINEVEDILSGRLGKSPLKIAPSLIKMICGLGSLIQKVWRGFPIHLGTYRKLTSTLTFSCEQAVTRLQWNPANVADFLKQCPLEEL